MTFLNLFRKNVLLLIILGNSPSGQAACLPKDKVVEYKNARVVYKNNKIIVSTGRIERTWEWTGNGLLTTSIRDKVTGREYAKKSGRYRCDWNLPGSVNDSSAAVLDDIEISENDDEGFTNENARRYWGYYNNPGSRHDPAWEMLEETVVTGYPLFLTEDNNWASGLSIEYNDGNDGMHLALKQFDRARYPVFPQRDMFILSNTLGPADPDGARFTEEDYLMKEIPAQSACTKKQFPESFFPGVYPGEVSYNISGNSLTLSNNAINAEWGIVDNSIFLKNITNKYDGDKVNLEHVILFAIELDGGRQLTNLEFKLKSKPAELKLEATDTMPTKALRFPGREISTSMVAEDKNIEILWKAQLRDGSNYIRQNIQITVVNKPVKISKVIFFDGKLEGAEYSGMVIGSPIKYKNFFFGFEHPIALSKALMARNIGPVSEKNIDVSSLIDGPGKYVVTVELGSSSDSYDLKSVSLLNNGLVVSTDEHSLIGKNGSSIYHLKLENYTPESEYQVHSDVINMPAANGDFHICRKTNGLLNFYVNRSDELIPGKSISEWAVIGVSPENQNRRAFLYYLERERARPYKQFLNYNCWWDITTDGASSFTSGQLIERMNAWNEKFIKPFGVSMQSFVFDDGWDNLDSVWYFDPVKFPQGFTPEAELCRKFNSGIGVWMSPFGGYGGSKQRRIEAAPRQGLETNDKGLSLAGPNYYNRFLSRAIDMLDNYKVNYFKFDGFGGSEPQYLPDMEAGAKLITTLRQHNPDVFINITVGSWPSPFWLKFADCTWRGSGDLHMAGKGTRTSKFMTYRDGTLHNNIVNKAPYYPLNSIMTVGIAYANLGLPAQCINDSIADFKDMVWSCFVAGSALQELYISPDRMKPDFWPVLAEAAKWVKSNEDVMYDTHWIGGSPLNMEVYGFASWTPRKGIITLRNPDDKPKDFEFTLDNILEIPDGYRGSFQLRNVRNGDNNKSVLKIASGESGRLVLKPFETIILEVIPE